MVNYHAIQMEQALPLALLPAVLNLLDCLGVCVFCKVVLCNHDDLMY